MTAPTPNHELINRAKAADPQALAAIYERYAPGIYRYIYYRVNDAELARDIQSDVFVRMLEGIGRYEDRGWSIGSWLYRIAHDRTIDTLRRFDRQPQLPLELSSPAVDGPDSGVDNSTERAAVRRGLSQLNESQRRVLLLRHEYGLSLEETARQMGRTVGSVKALQHRAVQRLGTLVRAELGEE